MSLAGESDPLDHTMEKSDEKHAASYNLLRAAGHYETYHTVYHESGFQSNVIASASYTCQNGEILLSKALLYPALQQVIQNHPALSVIISTETSNPARGIHRVWEAGLQVINLDLCVSFLHGIDVSGDGMSMILETQHNHWFDMDDKTQPLWRVLVVNGTYVIFVFSHIIADGKGGLAFHQSLLSAINKLSEHDSMLAPSDDCHLVSTSVHPLPGETIALFSSQGYRFSMLAIIWTVIYISLIRLFMPSSFFIFASAKCPYKITPTSTPRPKSVTRIQPMRMPSELMRRALSACKTHEIKFASLLKTLIFATLTNDIYPSARFGLVITTIDFRRFLPSTSRPIDGSLDMRNITGSRSDYMISLSRYRAAGRIRQTPTSPTDSTAEIDLEAATSPDSTKFAVNKEKFWSTAVYDNSVLQKTIEIAGSKDGLKSSVIGDYMKLASLPAEKEPFIARALPTMPMMIWGGISCSNLGLFDPETNEVGSQIDVNPSPWRISDAEFSFGATEPAMGFALYVGAISTKEGGCNVNFSYTNQMISDDAVVNLGKGVMGRLEWLLDNE